MGVGIQYSYHKMSTPKSPFKTVNASNIVAWNIFKTKNLFKKISLLFCNIPYLEGFILQLPF